MKVVLDSMLWVSYCTHHKGSRHRLIDRALKAKVRLFVSDYILDEVADVLREDLGETARFVRLARRAIIRRAKRVVLPKQIGNFVPGDPKDDAIVQTSFAAKADYIVTADSVHVQEFRLAEGTAYYVATYEHIVPGAAYKDIRFDCQDARSACDYILRGGVFAALERPVTAACALADESSGFTLAAANAE